MNLGEGDQYCRGLLHFFFRRYKIRRSGRHSCFTIPYRDVFEDVEKGDFRRDLFYRLNIVPIHIPPLRERVDDIPEMAGQFLKKQPSFWIGMESLTPMIFGLPLKSFASRMYRVRISRTRTP